VDTKRAGRLLARHRHTQVIVIVTVRGGFGTERHRLVITSTG
jgi:anti-sigma factor ChrR (cupin superfamily)